MPTEQIMLLGHAGRSSPCRTWWPYGNTHTGQGLAHAVQSAPGGQGRTGGCGQAGWEPWPRSRIPCQFLPVIYMLLTHDPSSPERAGRIPQGRCWDEIHAMYISGPNRDPHPGLGPNPLFLCLLPPRPSGNKDLPLSLQPHTQHSTHGAFNRSPQSTSPSQFLAGSVGLNPLGGSASCSRRLPDLGRSPRHPALAP